MPPPEMMHPVRAITLQVGASTKGCPVKGSDRDGIRVVLDGGRASTKGGPVKGSDQM